MADIVPFKAVRPAKDKAGLVTSRSYDEYSPAELASQLDYNPYSFLHVLNPAFAHLERFSSETRFKAVQTKYNEFKEEGVLKTEHKPVLFLYEIQSRGNTYTGIIAGTSVADCQNNIIKKHEDTLAYRVELFKDYLHHTGFNTEPVLVTYPENEMLEQWITDYKRRPRLYHFSTLNKDKHSVWRISNNTDIAWVQQQFAAVNSLYIADGHHRSASAELLYEQDKQSGNTNLSYFMSFLISENQLKIYEFNRVIHDLNGLSKEKFLNTLSKDFEIQNRHLELWKPEQKHQYGMYLDGDFYSLELKDKKFTSVLEALDAQVLYTRVLHPLLGIGDLRNDERIEYVPGTMPVTAIKQMIDEGSFKVGFMLYPPGIGEIKALADNNQIMPPKSTYIVPKFRSGLIVYEI